jgi:hypothetical protein
MSRVDVLKQAQQELLKHTFGAFVENPPSIAEGGHGVVVPGCTHCKKRLNTMEQFMQHLAQDVLPNVVCGREPGVE